MQITFNPKSWIAYRLTNDKGEHCGMGCCPIKQLMQLKGGTNLEGELTLTVLKIHDEKLYALDACMGYAHNNGLQFNPNNTVKPPRNQALVCNETGETFDSMGEAARHFDASVSAISNHIANRPGFKTVKGRTFSRYSE